MVAQPLYDLKSKKHIAFMCTHKLFLHKIFFLNTKCKLNVGVSVSVWFSAAVSVRIKKTAEEECVCV